jgi:hypothetical protein
MRADQATPRVQQTETAANAGSAMGLQPEQWPTKEILRVVRFRKHGTTFRKAGQGHHHSRATSERRRFSPPWSVDEQEACFIVRDANGQALAYVYFEDEPGRRAAAHLLTRDKARRIAGVRRAGAERLRKAAVERGAATYH